MKPPESPETVRPDDRIFPKPLSRDVNNIRISALWKKSARQLEQRWYRDQSSFTDKG